MVEVFAGRGALTTATRAEGFATASFDITYWDPYREAKRLCGKNLFCGNPLDLTTPAGFGLLGY